MKLLMVGPSNIGPYHIARFQALKKCVPDFTYLRVPVNEPEHKWNPDPGDIQNRIKSLKSGDKVEMFLERERPNIIITIGYNNMMLLNAARWAKRNNIPSVLQSDSTYDDQPRTWLKESLKTIIVRKLFDAAFVAGKRSADYVQSLGIPADAIWKGVNVVDNEHFRSSCMQLKMQDTFPVKYFLTVARISHEKNIQCLLDAFKVYNKKGGSWGLLIVGNGSQASLRKRSVNKNMENLICWFGWADYNQLPSLYCGASCFVLPSKSETWGLAVNEAMAAGLPILLSQKCGCVPELCFKGLNGYDFAPMDVTGLAELMLHISSGEVDLDTMGTASRKIISQFTPETWAKTVLEMARSLLTTKNLN